MSTNTYVPDRDELRALYDQAIDKLDPLRGNKLRTPFYTQTGDALFEACCLAMADTASGNKVMRTLSAPPGAGKTSFTYAMLIAIARWTERHPEQPIGAVLLSNSTGKPTAILNNSTRTYQSMLPYGVRSTICAVSATGSKRSR